jgi:hypothetical protein
MKTRYFCFSAILIALVAIQTLVLAQSTADKYVISAKAGGVNMTQGTVTVATHTGMNGILVKGETVAIGDRVSTGQDGRVEILLNPGSYVRLASDTDFEFKSTSLDDLRMLIGKGSAIFEVYATDEFEVAVETPRGAVNITVSGIYRVDVDANGVGRLSVFEGRAMTGSVRVRSGQQAEIGVAATAGKFDKKRTDELATWSKDRSKALARATNSLQRDDVRNSLISSYNMGHWGFFSSFGLWVYDPFWGYSFLPFGNQWMSPYGYRFRTSLWRYNLPGHIQPGYRNPPPGSGTTAPTVSTKRDIPADSVRPPYTKIESQQPVRQATPRWDIGDFDMGQPIRVNGGGMTSIPRASETITAAPAGPVSRPRKD